MSLLERVEEYKKAGLDVKEAIDAAREDMKQEREEREREREREREERERERKREEREREREREERERERQFELEKLRRHEGFRFVPTTTTIHTTASTDF